MARPKHLIQPDTKFTFHELKTIYENLSPQIQNWIDEISNNLALLNAEMTQIQERSYAVPNKDFVLAIVRQKKDKTGQFQYQALYWFKLISLNGGSKSWNPKKPFGVPLRKNVMTNWNEMGPTLALYPPQKRFLYAEMGSQAMIVNVKYAMFQSQKRLLEKMTQEGSTKVGTPLLVPVFSYPIHHRQ